MSRNSILVIGLIFLGVLLAASGCNTCVGDKEDNSGDVRCAGNILKTASSSSSSSSYDNDIFDLIDNPKNILIPDQVTIADSDNSFRIFKTEVTNEQFASFLKEKGARPALSQDGASNDCHLDNDLTALCYQFTGGGTSAKNLQNEDVQGGAARILDSSYAVSPSNASSHPVSYVSWYAAREFCTVVGWRLPTEKEWNLAAGTATRTYPWGETSPSCSLANFASDDAAFGYCAGDTISVNNGPVDSLGLRHMSGNVFEWTSTIIEDDDKEENLEDRVVKGGAWDSGVDKLKNSERTLLTPTSTLANLGFRCVK
ncbi:MAG: SUMF1/EgtB/PvdO family nonheme iron enzyme [SAR324 cluster bacterium]|nr:SUMF1/EgtB/PvdO family nonheme iron enzyme [SAR324 cluster bacterium]